MSNTITTLFQGLHHDSWRDQVGFSEELKAAQQDLFGTGCSRDTAAACLGSWLQRYQPCLFGRIAAKTDAITYCVLTEDDLSDSDENIQHTIQEARTKWTRQAYEGKRSGFIIFVVSEKIAYALPDDNLKKLAEKLCSLYLLRDILDDCVYHDDVFLEIPTRDRQAIMWRAGVNYFCANADKRWFQDHRIPGGMAFSVNSVGHMATSGMLINAMADLREFLGSDTPFATPKVDSLEKALELAMRTISMASKTTSGRATELVPLTDSPACPAPTILPPLLRDYDYTSYLGYYHTDYTIVSDYFKPDIDRPACLEPYKLDFTYLFENSIRNPDFITMGKGRPIRNSEEGEPSPDRSAKSTERLIDVDSHPRLRAALAGL